MKAGIIHISCRTCGHEHVFDAVEVIRNRRRMTCSNCSGDIASRHEILERAKHLLEHQYSEIMSRYPSLRRFPCSK